VAAVQSQSSQGGGGSQVVPGHWALTDVADQFIEAAVAKHINSDIGRLLALRRPDVAKQRQYWHESIASPTYAFRELMGASSVRQCRDGFVQCCWDSGEPASQAENDSNRSPKQWAKLGTTNACLSNEL